MIKYRININTNKIVEDNGNLGQFFFTEEWRLATTNEVNTYLLNIAKEKKITELKKNRTEYKKSIQINEYLTFWDCDAENIKKGNIVNFNFFNIILCVGFTQSEKDLFTQYSLYISKKYDKIKELIEESDINIIQTIPTTFEE